MSSPACQSPSSDSTRASEASAIERDADAVVGTLVRTLSRDERLLLCLRYADGLADEEIAALTRMSVDEVRRLMTSILDRTRSLVGSAA
jgi:DNA-directed RNA polymerase specialized sigma24 family protein